MLFDAPALMKAMGTVRVLREIKANRETYRVIAKALGLDPDAKEMSPTSIYIVQEAPDVEPSKG
jgi:hypothetical protein